MKPGESFDCPHCGQSSFLKKESVMDGWIKTGDVLKCAFCGTVISDAIPDEPVPEDVSAAGKKNALSALLGGETLAAADSNLLKAERRFCRDCVYRIATAFRIRCSKHGKDVNPMDDCPDYKPRIN